MLIVKHFYCPLKVIQSIWATLFWILCWMSVVQHILGTLTVVWLEEANLPFPSGVMVAFRWVSSTMSPTYSSLSASISPQWNILYSGTRFNPQIQNGHLSSGHPGLFYLENDTQVRTLQVRIFSQCWSRNPSTLNILCIPYVFPIKINSPKFCMSDKLVRGLQDHDWKHKYERGFCTGLL